MTGGRWTKTEEDYVKRHWPDIELLRELLPQRASESIRE